MHDWHRQRNDPGMRFSIRSNFNKLESMPRPLRFCHLSTFYPPYGFRGDAVYIYYLANSLAAQGHEVDIIHCADSYRVLAGEPTRDPLPHHPAVTEHTLRSPFGPLSPLLSQQTGRAVSACYRGGACTTDLCAAGSAANPFALPRIDVHYLRNIAIFQSMFTARFRLHIHARRIIRNMKNRIRPANSIGCL